MDRFEWQQISDERLLAAEALLASSKWPSAYYLAGYAVECGLKSCVLVRLAAEPRIIFDRTSKKFSEDCWTHDLKRLLKLAGLEAAIGPQSAAFRANWTNVANWNENSRYTMTTQADAEGLFEAITNQAEGVMPWIRLRW